MKLIKSISGIRGIYNQSLTKDFATYYAKSFSLIQPKGKILLARDTRPHGKILYDAIKDSLNNQGRTVLECDIIPTPTAQFIIKKENLAGGIVITASHNPIEWNGMKFIDSNGCFLSAEKNDLLFNENLKFQSKKNIIKNEIRKNAFNNHINHTLDLECININSIKKRNFKVVIDTVNGAGYKALPNILKKLGCEVIKINCKNETPFPRGTEPTPDNIKQLSDTVKNNNADIGFATDPDADRLAIVDNKGNPIGEELTLVLCLDTYLKYNNSSIVVTNLSTTLSVDKICKKYNAKLIRTPVGEINVVQKMIDLNSKIGGEGNGGIILSESHLGRDSIVGVALILNRLSESKDKLNNIVEEIPNFTMIKSKKVISKTIDYKIIKNYFSKNYNVISFNEDDGLKINLKDEWVHIRKSNTEPIIRIIGESKDIISTKHLISEVNKLAK